MPAARRSDGEETAEQPLVEEITQPLAEAKKLSRSTPKTEGYPTPEELDDDRPQVVRERDRMRAIYEERGRKS